VQAFASLADCEGYLDSAEKLAPLVEEVMAIAKSERAGTSAQRGTEGDGGGGRGGSGGGDGRGAIHRSVAMRENSAPSLGIGLTMLLLTRTAVACTRAREWVLASRCATEAVIIGKSKGTGTGGKGKGKGGKRKGATAAYGAGGSRKWPEGLCDRRVLLFTNECAIGLAAAAAVDQMPDKARKVECRCQALDHFAAALAHAVESNALQLVEAAARYVRWTTCLPLPPPPAPPHPLAALVGSSGRLEAFRWPLSPRKPHGCPHNPHCVPSVALLPF
jgi:hypothetical protein